MTLDIEFRQLLQRELEKTLDRIVEDKKLNISQIWQCKNEDDFLCGWYLGKIDDFCLNQYFIHYHKTPTNEDISEIQGMMFLHAKDLRGKLAK
jgi:hypothetical protein